LRFDVADQQKPKVVRNAGFGERLHQAHDAFHLAPRERYGRLTWLKNELAKHDVIVSVETVRKWFNDEAKPHPDRMKVVAQILEADQGWLLLGTKADETPRERRARNASADGAVNLVAGLIQLGGGTPAFPEPDDRRAKGVDVFAIIKGAQYAFKVVLATVEDGAVKFAVPVDHERFFVLGVVPVGGTHYDVVELAADFIETGVRRNGVFELSVTNDYQSGETALRQIKDFSARL
jgi:hypothetical protein